jgi:DNA-binding NtrC family response regulator
LSITSKPIILIVDDDTSILKTFARIFDKKGFSVTVAENGEQAIEKLKTTCFDIALIDFGLPDMEGTALFPLIEKLSPRTVRILLTGKTFLEGQVEFADDFIGKPVNPEKLLSVIDTALKLKDFEVEETAD